MLKSLSGCRLSLLLSLSLSGPAFGLATIGPSTDCTFNNALGNPIQSAINANHTDIRLVGGLNYNGSLNLTGNSDVQISGGYANCAAAALGLLPTTPARSNLVAGSAANAAVAIVPSANRRRVITLDRIDLKPPAAAAASRQGILADGIIDVHLLRSKISGYRFLTEADGRGGGVHLNGARLFVSRSEISQNHARLGGGVYCEGGGNVQLDPASLVLSNQAIIADTGGHGGGVYGDNCVITAHGRTLPVELGGSNGIIGNSATLLGGGIFASGGIVRVAGGPYCAGPDPAVCLPRLAVMALNQAKYGGAIASTLSASVELDFVNVSLNQATVSGGAIDATNGNVRVGGLGALWPDFDRSQCPEGICEQINQNRAATFGGAIYANGATLFVVDALLDNNRSQSGAAINSASAQATLQQVLIRTDNTGADNSLSIIRSVQGNLAVKRSSVVVAAAMAGAAPPAINGDLIEQIINAEGTDVQLQNSLLADFSNSVTPVQLSLGATLTGTCNAHLGNNIANALNLISDPMTLADVESDGLYTPTAAGALIDQCDGADLPLSAIDILGAPRVAAQTPQAFLRPLDIGAVERRGASIFANGFE